MGVILDSLHKIELGTFIRMVHRMSPEMLFPVLKKNGFDFIRKEVGDEEIEIYIFLKKDKDLKEYLQND